MMEDVGQKERSYLLVRMQNDAPTLEDSLATSYKAKCILTKQSSNGVHWYSPKEAATHVHTEVYSSIIH